MAMKTFTFLSAKNFKRHSKVLMTKSALFIIRLPKDIDLRNIKRSSPNTTVTSMVSIHKIKETFFKSSIISGKMESRTH